MTGRRRTVARFASAIGVAGLLLAIGPPIAGATFIKVNAPGNDPRGVDLETSELGNRDVVNVSYPLAGGNARTVTGWSLQRVLAVAATKPEATGWLDPSTIPSVSLSPPSSNVGAQIRVSSKEIIDQGIFGGGRTPVFDDNPDGSVDFIKPGRGGTAGVSFRYSVSVEIRVEPGSSDIKKLGLKVSPRAVEPGGKVSFKVTVPGRSSAGLGFAWKFREIEGGREFILSTRGGTLSRSFSRKGSYTVLVSLVDLPGFTSAVGSFTVGPPEEERGPDGRDRPPASSGQGPSGAALSGPAPASPAAPGSGLPGLSAGGGTGGTELSDEPAEPRDEAPDQEVPDGLEQVSGELIGPDVQVVELPPEEFGTESAGPSEVDEGPGFLAGVAGEAATLFGVGLLMALGGLIEVRFLSRRV